jgi:hypothetical protein
LGVARLDNFGGRSMLANLLPHASCAQVADAARTPAEASIVERHCRDDVPARGAADQLWGRDGLIAEIEREAVVGIDPGPYGETARAHGSVALGRLAHRLALAHPQVALAAMASNLRLYLGVSPPEQWSIRQLVHVDDACERLVADYLRVSKQEYVDHYARAAGETLVKIVDVVARGYSDLLEALTLLALVVLSVLVPRYARSRPEALLMTGLALLYLVGVTLASYYDARVYFVLTLLCSVAAPLSLHGRDAPA